MAELNYILPQIVLLVGSLSALLLGVFVGIRASFYSSLAAVVTALILAVRLLLQAKTGDLIFSGFLYSDPLSYFSIALVAFGSAIALLLSLSQIKKEGIDLQSEFYVLMLLSSLGASVLVMAADVSVFFISLEIMSLALYCLCGSAIWKSSSSESAVKYFVLGSFASALLLYGFSLIFALTGELSFAGIAEKVPDLDSSLFLFALALTSAGILFKVSAFPFHFWTADVYQGAPTSVTAFMAAVVKVASFSAAIRIFWLAFGKSVAFWSEFLPFIAVATMSIGTIMALRQKDLKRLLAFSSVAHSGYLLVGLLAGATQSQGIASLLFYLSLYLLMTLGTFSIVGAIVSERQDSKLSVLNGYAKNHPIAALFLSFFILCLAGLPPGVVGLIAKIQLFTSALRADYAWVVVFALINSAVGCYYYLRLIKLMYRSELHLDSGHQNYSKIKLSFPSMIIAGSLAVTLLFFSIMPGVLLTFCQKIAELG